MNRSEMVKDIAERYSATLDQIVRLELSEAFAQRRQPRDFQVPPPPFGSHIGKVILNISGTDIEHFYLI